MPVGVPVRHAAPPAYPTTNNPLTPVTGRWRRRQIESVAGRTVALGGPDRCPAPRDNSALPAAVREAYEAGLRVKKIDPGLYAVGIRRMLEAVCNDQGVTKGDLFERLGQLVRVGAIPGTLGEQAQELRKLGNLGAHQKDVAVSAIDVPTIEDFADAILEYVYRAPGQASRVAIEHRRPQSGYKSRNRARVAVTSTSTRPIHPHLSDRLHSPSPSIRPSRTSTGGVRARRAVGGGSRGPWRGRRRSCCG